MKTGEKKVGRGKYHYVVGEVRTLCMYNVRGGAKDRIVSTRIKYTRRPRAEEKQKDERRKKIPFKRVGRWRRVDARKGKR